MIDDHLGAVTDQLTEELAARLATVLRLAGPDGIIEADQRASVIAQHVALALCSADERERAETVIDLASALDIGADTDPEWWGTPVGRICAGSLAGVTPDADQVTAAQAADMLGVGRARVYQLLDGGKLDRHPDGGVTRASVYQRLART